MLAVTPSRFIIMLAFGTKPIWTTVPNKKPTGSSAGSLHRLREKRTQCPGIHQASACALRRDASWHPPRVIEYPFMEM